MATRAIARMELQPSIAQKLAHHNLTQASEVLLLSILDLMEVLDVTETEARQLQYDISERVAPSYQTALDKAFRRGIPLGAITELVGPAGVGKSQFCFMLSVLASAPPEWGGLGGGAIYLDTEKKLRSERIAEIAQARFPAAAVAGHRRGVPNPALSGLMGRVHIIQPDDCDALLHTLHSLDAGIIQLNAKLLVLDSIAALTRTEFRGRGGAMERAELLGQVAARLKHLAECFGIPVVVTNQVTTAFQTPTVHHQFQQQRHNQQQPQQQQQQQPGQGRNTGSGGQLVAALGTKWAHCVNNRLMLERIADRRFLRVAKSPGAGQVALEYHITARGVEQLHDTVLPEMFAQSVLEMSIANEVDYGLN